MSIWNPTAFTTPQEAFESRQRRYPLEWDPEHFVERRIYRQHADHYVPLPRTTQAPDTRLWLVEQDIMERIGNLITFYRDYANIPATHRRPTTTTYEFIGVVGERDPVQEPVTAEVEYRYFLPGVTPGIAKYRDIPVIERQKYHKDGDPFWTFQYINDGGVGVTLSSPTRTEYKQWVTDEKEIVAEDSALQVYLGNMIERQTVYIIAQ